MKKREEGLKLGADYHYANSGEPTFTDLAGSFDQMINTVSASIENSAYCSC